MTLASGVLSYNIPVDPARTEYGEEAAPSSVGPYSHWADKEHPNTGNKIKGWEWGHRFWSGESFENDHEVLPINWDPSVSGIPTSYFLSGIGSGRDLELIDIEQIPVSGFTTDRRVRSWAPEVNHGYYYDFDQERYLFSDDSEVQYPTYTGIVQGLGYAAPSGFNVITLDHNPKIGIPIKAEQYIWDSQEGKYDIYSSFAKRADFTGTRDVTTLVRADTYDENTESIIWDNVDKNLQEFVVTYSGLGPEVIFADQCVEELGSTATLSTMEVLGYSTGVQGEEFHTLYSPIDESKDIDIKTFLTTSGVATTWTAVPTDTVPSGYQAAVDYDLGIVRFGDTVQSGVLPSAGAIVGLHYWKTYRVEYEPENTTDTILAVTANLNNIYRKNSTGFIKLSTISEDPASIILEAELPEITSDVFGPLYIGNTLTSLVATVYDSRGNKLEGQEVTFEINSVPSIGSLGTGTTAVSSTDQYGEARTYYSSPRSIDEIGEAVTATNWSMETSPSNPIYLGMSEITKLRLTTLPVEGNLEEVFVYETHIDDPVLGFLDLSGDTSDIEVMMSGYYHQFFTEHGITGSTGLDPITGRPTTGSMNWEENHRLIWDLTRPSIFSAMGGRGRRRLVAFEDPTMTDPHTFTYGAIGPFQPVNVENPSEGIYDVVFNTSAYQLPKPPASDTGPLLPSGTLHNYFVIAPTSVSLQAHVVNHRLNRVINSNEISIQLKIPPYLSGLWTIDAINQNHIDEISSLLGSMVASGQRVPLGFRLRSSTVTLASALDGVTFLDENPEYNYDPWDIDTTYLPTASGVVISGVQLGQQIRVFPITP